MSLPALSLLLMHVALAPAALADATGREAVDHVICEVHAMTGPQSTFGEAGQRTLGLRNSLLVEGYRIAIGETVTQDVTFALEAHAGYFLTKHVMLGGLLGYSHERAILENPAQNALRLGPEVAYNVPINTHVSFLPAFGVLYGYASNRNAHLTATHRLHTVSLALDLSFVVTLREHLSVSFGPFIKQSIYGHRPASLFTDGVITEASSVQTLYGLSIGLLGWF